METLSTVFFVEKKDTRFDLDSLQNLAQIS